MFACGFRKKKRAVIMMVTVVALFAVCWAPFHVVHMMIEYSECLSFSFDRHSLSFPVRIDNESLKCATVHLDNQIPNISCFFHVFKITRSLCGRSLCMTMTKSLIITEDKSFEIPLPCYSFCSP